MQEGRNEMITDKLLKISALFLVVYVAYLFTLLPVCSANSGKAPLSEAERLRLGEKIYREGLLPSGVPMQAVVRNDIPTPGTLFSCVSCHLRSGLGSFEGGVFTPPTTGSKVFQPYQTLYKGTAQNPKYFPIPPRRPAYTEKTLSIALQEGVDPNGRALNDVMPRYQLEPEDMSILIDYLKSLSREFPAGVTDTDIRFATVISEDVSPADRDAVLLPLQNFFKLKNDQVRYFKTPGSSRSLLMAQNMTRSKEFVNRTLTLSQWVLKGPPDTWRGQLEAYYKKEPVFALIGGMTTGTWEPVHRFSEDYQIPALFPYTEFPVISQTDWYTLYLSKGYYREGEAAARYLHSISQSGPGKKIVQLVRASREGQALAAGFQETWRVLGHTAVPEFTLKSGEDAADRLKEIILNDGRPDAVLVWDGPAAPKIVEELWASEVKPDIFFISSSYAGSAVYSLKEELRGTTYITFPYRLPAPADQPSSGHPLKKSFAPDTSRIANHTYALIEILTMALMDMKGNYYRDNFLDVISMTMDIETPLFERISFGPGQRYASKGCYIVQLGSGPKPQVIRKSDWVIY
jgi:hypothetical protein